MFFTDVDRVVSAEIPDTETNPELDRIVTSHMIHGLCGQWNRDSPCTESAPKTTPIN